MGYFGFREILSLSRFSFPFSVDRLGLSFVVAFFPNFLPVHIEAGIPNAIQT